MWLNQLIQVAPGLLGLVVLAEKPGESEEHMLSHRLLLLSPVVQCIEHAGQDSLDAMDLIQALNHVECFIYPF